MFDCAATPKPDTPVFLIGTSWRLVGVIVDGAQQSPSQPNQYLTFESPCRISGYDSCNAFAARVEVFEPDHYITSSQGQTARGCMWTAELPHAATGEVVYELAEGELRLYAPGDTSKMFVFTAMQYKPSEYIK